MEENPGDTNNKQLLLLQQWNEDLEGVDFSLEPFLKKCKQEQEQSTLLEGFLVGLILNELLNNNALVNCDQPLINPQDFGCKLQTTYNVAKEEMMKSSLNGYIPFTQGKASATMLASDLLNNSNLDSNSTNTTYQQLFVNQQGGVSNSEEFVFPVQETQISTKGQKKGSENCLNSTKKQKRSINYNKVHSNNHKKDFVNCTNKLIIHVEHPEKPKEKKKRGRPCKRNEEFDNYADNSGKHSIVFVTNCFEGMERKLDK
ncbi:hypothetical protein ABK040_006018 [Willaertia magna]